ncbi:alanine aminotransferase 2-like isoform X2 [Cynoglossus semilaevis]|uniref:alanine aminotransferase 2-like isoform X2 n=1 Tax=Cynoglossus semilaevis TaxID=244447 RepID=UPI000D6311A3|nr:alanine aminotransferase 2-like isoform X2 [Cynoglossus semilaevis]
MTSMERVIPTVNTMSVPPQQALQALAEGLHRDIKQGAQKHFQRIINVSSADPHRAGIKSLSFVRQVLAACLCPQLLKDKSLPLDVRQRARTLLEACDGGSVGAYSPSAGLTYVRRSIADFITRRDGGVPSHSDDIFICAGSHRALMVFLKLLARGKGKTHTGVLTPVPCPSTLPVLLDDVDVKMMPYQLNEERGWAVDVDELQRALTAARGHCEPRAIYISNPGNPTGHVQNRKSIEEVIQFAADHKLLILANEVDQDCVYGPDAEFISYKKVLLEMDQELAESVQLVSFQSVSSSFLGEGGLRAGYMETINIDPEVIHYIEILLCFDISTPVTGQLALDLMVNPPKPGDQSYDTYIQEVLLHRTTLTQNAQRVVQALNVLPGMSCQPSMGGVYLYPSLRLPPDFMKCQSWRQMFCTVRCYCRKRVCC